MKRRVISAVLISMLALPFQAQALAYSPGFGVSSHVSQAVEGSLEQSLYRRGYGTGPNTSVYSDPRAYSTATSIGSAATAVGVTIAADVVLSKLGPVGWLGIALNTLAGYAIPLAVDGLFHLMFNQDGTATVPEASTSIPSYTTYPGPTPYYYAALTSSSAGQPQVYAQSSSIYGAFAAAVALQGGTVYTNPVVSGSPPYTTSTTYVGTFMWADSSQGTGEVRINPSWFPATGTLAPAVPGVGTSIPLVTALNNIPPTELAKPMNPDVVARMVNDLWSSAAATAGYSGIPYNPQNPVTSDDVKAYQAASPDSYPTVKDFLSPQPTGRPFVTPDYSPNTGTNSGAPVSTPNPATAPLPVVATPAPGSTPAQAVDDAMPAAPLGPTPESTFRNASSSFDGWRAIQFDAGVGSCPAISLVFDIPPRHFNLTSTTMCDKLEQYKIMIKALCAFGYLAAAIRRVFSA